MCRHVLKNRKKEVNGENLKLVFTRPKYVLYGVGLRCIIIPGIAFCIAKVLNLHPSLAAGLILVGACPSGTASDVMTFIAKRIPHYL
ncbi:MAG: hypothetical protein ACRDBM_04710 [Sporomusa sp.]